MKKHTCKLCFRRFPNGRALGGHMRSHVSSAAAPPAASDLPSGDSSASASSCEAVPDGDDMKPPGASYGLRENPRKSFRLVDPEFSSAAEPGLVQDRESETDSPRHPAAAAHRQRSKRSRCSAASAAQPPDEEPASSASGTTTEEDVARCLMMLSRDSWTTEAEAEEGDGSDGEDAEASQPIGGTRSSPPPQRGRGRYQCGTCKKVFQSYQALGGHRAGHKKPNGCVPAVESRIHGVDEGEANAEAKLHECPFCFRVFSSGQALGGHKRSHLISSSANTTTITITSPAPCSMPPVAAAKFRNSFTAIDLNMPAPMEDDMELSAVSDADFLTNPAAN